MKDGEGDALPHLELLRKKGAVVEPVCVVLMWVGLCCVVLVVGFGGRDG